MIQSSCCRSKRFLIYQNCRTFFRAPIRKAYAHFARAIFFYFLQYKYYGISWIFKSTRYFCHSICIPHILIIFHTFQWNFKHCAPFFGMKKFVKFLFFVHFRDAIMIRRIILFLLMHCRYAASELKKKEEKCKLNAFDLAMST